MKQLIPHSWQDVKRTLLLAVLVIAAFFLVIGADGASAQSSDPEQSGSVGLTGTISAPAPTQGAVISFPTNGQIFSDTPITVTGTCPPSLIVKIFKNNVFAGSVMCEDNGTFSLQTDLFVGINEIVARVYDDLDQAGPDSNVVTVTYQDNTPGLGPKVIITSNYAKRGVDPGNELIWPVILSGGTGPYAFSVDWGDGTEPDLFTQAFAGNIDLKHIYDRPGIYRIIIKVVDSNGNTAFLQLVGVANGPLSQTTESGDDPQAGYTATKTKIVWWPAALIVPFAISTFWLGKRYMVHVLKKRIERGEHPFADV